MAAVWNRVGYYIFAMWFLLLLLLFRLLFFLFPRLISTVANWMSTIFRMQV